MKKRRYCAILIDMKKIELSYQKNVRDLGGLTGFNGKKVKEGRVFRGGFLGRVSKKDIDTINSLHLTDIIDFRSSVEYNDRPDYRFEGVTYHNFPVLSENIQNGPQKKNEYEDSNLLWFLEGSTDGYGHMCKVYRESFTTESGNKAYKKFFEVLLQDDRRTVYFHCSQGKDRAGLAAYLFETALGVSQEEAVKDYLLTNEAMEPRLRQLKAMVRYKPFYNKDYDRAMDEVFAVNVDYLNAAVEAANKEYGSIMNYIKNVLCVNIDKLREFYLE